MVPGDEDYPGPSDSSSLTRPVFLHRKNDPKVQLRQLQNTFQNAFFPHVIRQSCPRFQYKTVNCTKISAKDKFNHLSVNLYQI